MNYSIVAIIQDSKEKGYVDGVWMQDHSGGTLETAIQAAIATDRANGGRLRIGVVEFLGQYGGPIYNYQRGMKLVKEIGK